MSEGQRHNNLFSDHKNRTICVGKYSSQMAKDIIKRCKELQIDRDEPAWDYGMPSTTKAKAKRSSQSKRMAGRDRSKRSSKQTSVAEDLTCGSSFDLAMYSGVLLDPVSSCTTAAGARRAADDAAILTSRRRENVEKKQSKTKTSSNSKSRSRTREGASQSSPSERQQPWQEHRNRRGELDADIDELDKEARLTRRKSRTKTGRSVEEAASPTPSSSDRRGRQNGNTNYHMNDQNYKSDSVSEAHPQHSPKSVVETRNHAPFHVTTSDMLAVFEKRRAEAKRVAVACIAPKKTRTRQTHLHDGYGYGDGGDVLELRTSDPAVRFDKTMAGHNPTCGFMMKKEHRAPTPPRQKAKSGSQKSGKSSNNKKREDERSYPIPQIIKCMGSPQDDELLVLSPPSDLHGRRKEKQQRRKEQKSSSTSPSATTTKNKKKKKSVRFTRPFVTSIQTRPKTDPQDIEELFFCEDELWELEKDRLSRIYEEQVECIAVESPESNRLYVSVAFPNRKRKDAHLEPDVDLLEDKAESEPTDYLVRNKNKLKEVYRNSALLNSAVAAVVEGITTSPTSSDNGVKARLGQLPSLSPPLSMTRPVLEETSGSSSSDGDEDCAGDDDDEDYRESEVEDLPWDARVQQDQTVTSPSDGNVASPKSVIGRPGTPAEI